MRTYVAIQVPSPADGAGFVAQWVVGGQRSGPAFALANTGELLFFAHGATAPLIVADAATGALLAARGCTVLSTVDEHCT